MGQRILVFSMAVLIQLCWPLFSLAEPDNSRALQGLTTVKMYFDVNVGAGGKLATRLQLINTTHDQLTAAGVRPEMIVGFRGKASLFITRDDDYVFEEDIAAKQKVHAWIRQFKAKGIIMEQCLIAAGFHDIEAEDFLPEVRLIQNGYISMAGYQTKGYAHIPMD